MTATRAGADVPPNEEAKPARLATIVVGVDGGPGGVDAMALARGLAGPRSTVIAVAIAAVDPQPSAKANPDFDRAAREEAHERLTDLRAQEPELRTEVLRARYVGDGLRAAAKRFDADLLVVGSCRRGLAGRIFIGDDTRETLRAAPCPVAVATRDYALTEAPIATVGLGWARQEASDDALVFAEDLARDLGARLHALTPVDLHASSGDAVDELLAFAAEVDVLVVGAHHRRPLERLLLGSTSEQLSRRSARPLVVVPQAP